MHHLLQQQIYSPQTSSQSQVYRQSMPLAAKHENQLVLTDRLEYHHDIIIMIKISPCIPQNQYDDKNDGPAQQPHLDHNHCDHLNVSIIKHAAASNDGSAA